MRTSACRVVTALMLSAVVFCGCANTGAQSPAAKDGDVAQETAETPAEGAEESEEAGEGTTEDSSGNVTEDADESSQTQRRSSTSMTRAGNYRTEWANKTGSAKADDNDADDAGSSNDAALETVRVPAPKTTRYTVMVYMIGSNLESGIGAASDDIAEMLASGVDFSKANVIVYTGGSRRWNSDIPADHNNVLDLSLGEEGRIVAQTAASANMGDASTLASFLDFCEQYYPAEHTALVFWDHGGGPLWGFGVDEVNGGDGLLLSELRDALEASPFAVGGSQEEGAADKKSAKTGTRKLDWVGFDACLMGSLESAALWSGYADMMVASEEVEPGDGWNWSYLAVLNDTVDATQVTTAILEGYDAHYKEVANTFSNPDVTLSALDLSQVSVVVDALDDLVAALGSDVTKGSYAAVNRARHDAKAFGLSAVDTRSAAYDLVDVVDLAQRLKKSHPKEAEALVAAAEKLVVDHVGNVDTAHGVSLYFPGENRELFETYDELGKAGAKEQSSGGDVAEAGDTKESDATAGATNAGTRGTGMLSATYDDFVDKYTGEWLESTKVDWTLADPKQTEDGPTLQLSEDQVESFASASYTLLQESTAGRYYVITSEVEVPLESDGSVKAPQDPVVICSKTDLHRAVPGWFAQVESGDDSATYVNRSLYLSPAGNFRDFDATTDARVNVSVQVANETGDVTIESVTTGDEAVSMGGRSTVDVTKYTMLWQMHYGGGMLHVLYDASNNPLPWEEWESDGYAYNAMPVEDGFGFVSLPASEVLESYAVQIVVTDVNGNRHATPPISLTVDGTIASEGRKVKRATELGKATYTVFEDHAELSQYEGDDWTVEIPAEVEGVPVTAIGERAFANARYLDELNLPEGIEDIGASAFMGSGLYSITLPSTLKHVAPAAFFSMGQLAEFKLRSKSEAVSVKDGVLFSADGKTLITYPQGKGGTYTVPEGTESLGYGSFAESGIQEVELPEGLVSIGNAAFYGCDALSRLELPQSLEQVGALAFGRQYYSDGANIETVRLGPNVSSVGDHAFSGLNLQSIEVDSANAYYQGKGGCLLNAAGDAILEAPMGMGQVVEVPEGVVSLGAYAFYDYDEDTEFILPASLAICEETSLPYGLEENGNGGYTKVHTCVIHAPQGSFAERYAADRGIAYDNVVDRDLLVYETQMVEQGDYMLCFRVYKNRSVLVAVGDASSSDIGGHELVIPNEVGGMPVTELAISEFSAFDDWETNPSGLENLTLPHTLQKVGDSGLRAFSGLKYLSFDAECSDLQVVDDVLFSADGKTLCAYPAAREGATYEVPDGVKDIAPNAFYGSEALEEVTLPNSVQTIGDRAFYNCEALATMHFGSGLLAIGEDAFSSCDALELEEPLPSGVRDIGESAFWGIGSYEGLVLPKNLETLGARAFSASYEAGNQGRTLPVAQGVLSIGKRLSSFGRGALDGLGITSFEIAKGNKSYKAEGPLLLTADGRRVVAYANGFEGAVEIPASVRELDLSVFEYAYGMTELTIPPTVTYISGSMSQSYSSPQDTPNPDLVVHVKRGSTAERYALEEGLAWSME